MTNEQVKGYNPNIDFAAAIYKTECIYVDGNLV
jgi:hypothetical protein